MASSPSSTILHTNSDSLGHQHIRQGTQLGTHATSALVHLLSNPSSRRARAVIPAQEMLCKNKTGDALEEGTRLERLLVFGSADQVLQSRREPFPSQGTILVQIHPDRTV